MEKWLPLERSKSKHDIHDNAWNDRGWTPLYPVLRIHITLDASVLLMESYGFV